MKRSNMGTVGVVSAVGLLASAAFAQPATFTDLGNHNATGPFSTPVTLTSPSDIQWFKVILPATPVASPAYVDIWTVSGGSDPMTDTEVGVYDNSGALVASDDDDSDGLFTALSFGATTPTRPAIGAGTAFNGRDGVLAGGTYWVAVGRFNVTFNASNWDATSTATAQTTTTLNFDVVAATELSGAGSVTPSPAVAGGSALFRVQVNPAQNPSSTNIQVVANLSSVGGSASQALNDAGQNGDVTAGDNIFSYSYAIPGSQAGGPATWSFTVTDAQARNATGTNTVTILGAGTWLEGATDAGELPADAQATTGTGSLPSIIGNIAAAADTDMYRIQICSPANFNATLVNDGTPTGTDTQLFLFRPDGTGIAHNDDSSLAPIERRSTISNQLTSSLPAGEYLLAVSRYDRDPQDASAAALWLDQPFDGQRAPDGPGAANAVASWAGTGGTGAYRIDLTGACLGSGGGGCAADTDDGTRTGTPDGAVTIDDLIYFLIAFEDGNLDADLDNGTRSGTTDGAVTIDDLVYFLIRFEEGC